MDFYLEERLREAKRYYYVQEKRIGREEDILEDIKEDIRCLEEEIGMTYESEIKYLEDLIQKQSLVVYNEEQTLEVYKEELEKLQKQEAMENGL